MPGVGFLTESPRGTQASKDMSLQALGDYTAVRHVMVAA
jgi:hypothetical protein